MQGITNAQKTGGGSGGEWTEHISTDWNDLFETDASNLITAKKDVIIFVHHSANYADGVTYIPKGMKGPTTAGIQINISGASSQGSNLIEIHNYAYINNASIGSNGTIPVNRRRYTFTITTDNNISIVTSSGTLSVDKSQINIWSKD